MNDKDTFRAIETQLGITTEPAGDSPLEDWYTAIRDKSLGSFSDRDLATSCRQQLYLEYVIPFAIARLQKEPLAGHLYDGELLASLIKVPADYWLTHGRSAKDMTLLLDSLTLNSDDAALAQEVQTLRTRVGPPQ